MATTTTTTTVRSTENVTRVTADFTTNTRFSPPKMRARTVVLIGKKLKPLSAMNVFISGLNANPYFAGCTKVQITSTGTFLGGESTDDMSDRITERTTSVNSYDIIKRGEVITCTTGSAVVVADETIREGGSNKRVLYVTNVKGTISGTITGATSLSTGTVVAVTSGNNTTNSLGHFYGVLTIPALTFNSGSNKILITDDTTANPAAATTMADAGYVSNGIVNVHTRNISTTSQSVTTVRNHTTNTYYAVEYTGGGE